MVPEPHCTWAPARSWPAPPAISVHHTLSPRDQARRGKSSGTCGEARGLVTQPDMWKQSRTPRSRVKAERNHLAHLKSRAPRSEGQPSAGGGANWRRPRGPWDVTGSLAQRQQEAWGVGGGGQGCLLWSAHPRSVGPAQGPCVLSWGTAPRGRGSLWRRLLELSLRLRGRAAGRP